MTEANQVRINELARELEVKAKAIIDLLPGYGVTEKKTHSSSIPEDVAVKVRQHLKGIADAEAAAEEKAKADKDARDAAAKAARMRPAVAPAAAPPAPAAAPAAAKPAVLRRLSGCAELLRQSAAPPAAAQLLRNAAGTRARSRTCCARAGCCTASCGKARSGRASSSAASCSSGSGTNPDSSCCVTEHDRRASTNGNEAGWYATFTGAESAAIRGAAAPRPNTGNTALRSTPCSSCSWRARSATCCAVGSASSDADGQSWACARNDSGQPNSWTTSWPTDSSAVWRRRCGWRRPKLSAAYRGTWWSRWTRRSGETV